MAHIAATIERGYVKHPKKVKLKNHLLDFNRIQDKSSKPQLQKKKGLSKERMQKSKSFWKGLTGLIGKKKKTKLPKKVKQSKG
ncbi:MAG: hypothetical protein ACTSO3_01180 [Candidatus Heimdallarchaeaceae archaeon]